MSHNSVQSFVIENSNGPTIEKGLKKVCLHPLSRAFTFTQSNNNALFSNNGKSPFVINNVFLPLTKIGRIIK